MRRVSQGIDKVRDAYGNVVAGWSRKAASQSRRSSASSEARPICFVKATPVGFLPEEDQGAFFTEIRLPEGATVGRTRDAMIQVEKIIGEMPGVADVTSVIGFSLLNGLAQSNTGFMAVHAQAVPRPQGPRHARRAVDGEGAAGDGGHA